MLRNTVSCALFSVLKLLNILSKAKELNDCLDDFQEYRVTSEILTMIISPPENPMISKDWVSPTELFTTNG